MWAGFKDMELRMKSSWDGEGPPIGEAVYLARCYRRMSQAELARKSKVHVSSINGIERGTRCPSYSVLIRLAIALEMELSRLIKKAETLSTAPERVHSLAID